MLVAQVLWWWKDDIETKVSYTSELITNMVKCFLIARGTYDVAIMLVTPYVQTFQPLTQSSGDRLKENDELI